jgi:hypothetical protein
VPSCGRAAGIRRGHDAKQHDRPRVPHLTEFIELAARGTELAATGPARPRPSADHVGATRSRAG